MTHKTTLYLHAVATAEQPDAGWKIDGDDLLNVAGDRVTIRHKMYGQTVSIHRRNGQHGHAFAESVDYAWKSANEYADASKARGKTPCAS